MDIDPANNAVTAWRANNDSSIELTASGSGDATNLLYDASDLNGQGGIRVNDFTSETMGLSGSIGDLDLVESTIFWLGYYAPGRDGSTGDGFGQYAYNYYNGGSYISHQSDDGVVEHYSPTRAGDAIDVLEGDYQVWTTVTYGSSPGTSMYVNGIDLNVAPHDGILSDGAVADTFQMFRYSSSGYNFVGNMHECIIYEGALSAGDIAAVEAYLDAKRAAYDGLPEVSSGALAAHFVADPSTMDIDPANNAVTAWRASNNLAINLTASGTGAATNILYDASDLNGQGGIRVNDFTSETMGLEGSIGDLDLAESTIFWLGYYAPGREGSTDDGSGQYAYNYYNGGSYISHQSDDGVVEHYSPTRAGDAIDMLEGDYQVWTTVTYGVSPGTSMYVNGVDLNVAPHDGIFGGGGAVAFQMFRYSSSGYNFVGNMHECIIYEGALSAADIATIEAYLDAKRTPPGPGTAYCFGSGTACACGNAGSGSAGCANSTGAGGTLTASGDPSLSSDTIVLTAANLVSGQPCLFFSGSNQVNGGVGITFGDGLRCAGNEAVRIQVTAADSSGNAATSVEVSTNGQAYGHTIDGGETVHYQCWYRDDIAISPCGNSFNLTNGYTLVWSS